MNILDIFLEQEFYFVFTRYFTIRLNFLIQKSYLPLVLTHAYMVCNELSV